MPDREAIIEAMAEAMWLSQPGPRMPYWNQAVWERFATAAYDASPIERYREALEVLRGMEMFGVTNSLALEVAGIAERALRGDD